MTTTTDIISSARLVGPGADTGAEHVELEIDYVGCYGDLPLADRQAVEAEVAGRFGLVGWHSDGIQTPIRRGVDLCPSELTE